MLVPLKEEFAELLSARLHELSQDDRIFFHPHTYDTDSIKHLCNEKGNHYYLYFDEADSFAGYGMLRTFGKYRIPTLGCIIWQPYRKSQNGKKIVRQLLDEAIRFKYGRVLLKVHPKNYTAHNLYTKMGFKQTGIESDGQILMEFNFHLKSEYT